MENFEKKIFFAPWGRLPRNYKWKGVENDSPHSKTEVKTPHYKFGVYVVRQTHTNTRGQQKETLLFSTKRFAEAIKNHDILAFWCKHLPFTVTFKIKLVINGFKIWGLSQGSKEVPSGCPGQVYFFAGQVTFHILGPGLWNYGMSSEIVRCLWTLLGRLL